MFKKATPEGEVVEILDRPLTCQICHNDHFYRKEGKLTTSMLAFFDLEWTAPTAVCFICDQCGYIHWFLPQE